MDIFSVLKEEHAVVKEIFKKIEETTNRAEKGRADLFETLKREFYSHAEAEREVLYTRLEQEEGLKDMMAEAEEEHALAEKLIDELDGMDPTTIEWMAKVTVLRENVEHHVKEEEGDIFTAAKKVLKEGEAEEIADAFKAEKERIKEGM
ncbi:MAG: hemerythrin domain-containing protein [Patescibacteria group bacterium]